MEFDAEMSSGDLTFFNFLKIINRIFRVSVFKNVVNNILYSVRTFLSSSFLFNKESIFSK